MPIWKPFIDWMAAWALPGLSKLTNPGGKAKKRERGRGIRLDEEAKDSLGVTKEWIMRMIFNKMKQSLTSIIKLYIKL